MEKQRLSDCLNCERQQLVRPDRPDVQGSFTCVNCHSPLLLISVDEGKPLKILAE